MAKMQHTADDCPFKDFVPAPHSPTENDAIDHRLATVEREVSTVVQAVQDMARTWGEAQRSAEAKFTTLFDKIDKSSAEAVRRSEALGDKLTADIKGISATRASTLFPQIVAILTVAGLFSGAVYMSMSGQTSMLNQQIAAQNQMMGQQMGTVIDAMHKVEDMAASDLKDVNKRLYESQNDKGHADERVGQLERAFDKFEINYQAWHRDLDSKLQRETDKEGELLKIEIAALDKRLQSELATATGTLNDKCAELRVEHRELNSLVLHQLQDRLRTFDDALIHQQLGQPILSMPAVTHPVPVMPAAPATLKPSGG